MKKKKIVLCVLICLVLSAMAMIPLFAVLNSTVSLSVKEVYEGNSKIYVDGVYKGDAPYDGSFKRGAEIRIVSGDSFLFATDKDNNTISETKDFVFKLDTDKEICLFNNPGTLNRVYVVYRNTNDTKQVLYAGEIDVSSFNAHKVESANKYGYTFVSWNKTVQEIKNAVNGGAKFIIVEPVYIKDSQTVTVKTVNGKVNGEYSVEVEKGTSVSLEPTSAVTGEKFGYWVNSDGEVISIDGELTLPALCDETYKAVFVKEDDVVEMPISTFVDSKIENGNIELYTFRYIPSTDNSVIGGGLIYTTDTEYGGEMVLENVDGNTLKLYEHSNPTESGFSINTIKCTNYAVAVPYLTYKDGTEVKAIYGEKRIFGANRKISYYIDGKEVLNKPSGNYVFYVEGSDENSFESWNYTSNSINNVDNGKTYKVYAFTVDKLYDTVSAMTADTSIGNYKTVGVKGYSTAGKGASIWKVVSSTSLSSTYYKSCKNSKKAELMPFTVKDKKIITPEMLGAKGDGTTSDSTVINNAFAYTRANYITFESKKYLQTKALKLSRGDITIDGRGAEIDNKYDYIFSSGNTLKVGGTGGGGAFDWFSSTVGEDFVISGTSSAYLNNVTLKNLSIVCTEMRGVGSLYNRIASGAHTQLQISYVNNITVSGCSLIVPERTGIGTGIVDGTRTDSEAVGEIIKFNGNSISLANGINNALIENNKMVNLSGGCAGCTVDIAWGTHTNYIFRNNYVEKNTHDETFTIYGTDLFDGGDIYGNTFYSHDEPSDCSPHVIGFGANAIKGFLKNVKFHDNTVRAVSRMDCMIFEDVENIEVYNNDMEIYPNKKGDTISYGFFRITKNTYTTTQKNVYIHDNTIAITNPTKLPMNYNCNTGFKFENNTFNWKKTTGEINLPFVPLN